MLYTILIRFCFILHKCEATVFASTSRQRLTI